MKIFLSTKKVAVHFTLCLSTFLIGVLIAFWMNSSNRTIGQGLNTINHLNVCYHIPLQRQSIDNIMSFENEDTLGVNEIFCNNLSVCVLLAVSGILSFGLITHILLFYNGYILGFVIYSALSFDFSWLLILNKLIWHGLSELYVLLYFSTIGSYIGFFLLLQLKKAFMLPTTYKSIVPKYFRTKQLILHLSLLYISACLEYYVSLAV